MFKKFLKLFKRKENVITITQHHDAGFTYRRFTIPVGDKSREEAEKSLSKLIEEYKKEITYDESYGSIKVNGKPHIPYNKEYWIPEEVK